MSNSESKSDSTPAPEGEQEPCPFEPGSENYWSSATTPPDTPSDAARAAAVEIADRWFKGDLPERARVHSTTRRMLLILAEDVISKYLAATHSPPSETAEPIDIVIKEAEDDLHRVCPAMFAGEVAPVPDAGDDEGEERNQMNLIHELTVYLDALTITSDNIGDIRRSCFMPWKSRWNGIVREQTAERERSPDPAAHPSPALETPVSSRVISAMADILSCAYPANVNDRNSSLLITRRDYDNLAEAHRELTEGMKGD